AATFLRVDIPSFSPSISNLLLVGGQLPPLASLNDSMKRGTIRSRTNSGPFLARYSPAAPAASSAAGTRASRAASQPPESAELSISPMSPLRDDELPLLEWPLSPPRCESAFFAP